jgi:hypothetical protein
MNLHGSITEHQNRISQLYLKLEQRFRENSLIHELWGSMAKDISLQVSSLNSLPKSLWSQLKENQDGLVESIHAVKKIIIADNKEDIPLRACFERTLQVEEPTILNIYVPIIRRLRENWTGQALDFYIMVKAHLARITRITEAFSGDPLIIQRSNWLLRNFEKEVQEPQISIVLTNKKKLVKAPRPAPKEARKRPRKPLKSARPLIKHSKIRPSRAKPLLNKVNLRRRRAHR